MKYYCETHLAFLGRGLLLFLTIFVNFGSANSQEIEIVSNLDPTGDSISKNEHCMTMSPDDAQHVDSDDKGKEQSSKPLLNNFRDTPNKHLYYRFLTSGKADGPNNLSRPTETIPFLIPVHEKAPEQYKSKDKFHWRDALAQSALFVAMQHSFRMIQKKTRDELDGPFFADWGNSLKNLRGWSDGDSSFTNYIAHPMQGSSTGRIFVNNSDKAKRQEFGRSKEYWESRIKAMAWSAVTSFQFELGPISEASIGNVGLYDRVGPNHMGWVDLVITPTTGTGLMIGEDVIDKLILKKWLERDSDVKSKKIKLLRTFLTPVTSFMNVLRFKVPWTRDNR